MDEEKPKNSVTDIGKFFSTPEHPVKTAEMLEFWKSLTDEEKNELLHMNLT